MDFLINVLALIGGVASIWQIFQWTRSWYQNRIASLGSVQRYGLKLIKQIEEAGFKPQLVLGIGRGGGFLGGWLAGNLGSLPFEVVERTHNSGSHTPVEFPFCKAKMAYLAKYHGDAIDVLVVEAATTRGATLREFEKLRAVYLPGWTCKYCVLFNNSATDFPIQFVARTLDRIPRRYPWHATDKYRHHVSLQYHAEALRNPPA